MKNSFSKILYTSISIVFHLTLYSQTNRFYYKLDYRHDSSQNYRTTQMILDINPKTVKFYDADFIKYDSINIKNKNTESRYSTKTDQLVSRKRNSSENFWYRDFLDYFIVKTKDDIKWSLKSEKLTYDSYILQKAETDFGGRHWIAWFSVDVPISEGPFKFNGLPGLIFLIKDSQDNFIYTLIKNTKLDFTYDTNNFLETRYGKSPLKTNIKTYNNYVFNLYENPSKMFLDKIKNGDKINFKDQNVESLEDLYRKKKSMQNGIKNRFIPLELDSAINFPN